MLHQMRNLTSKNKTNKNTFSFLVKLFWILSSKVKYLPRHHISRLKGWCHRNNFPRIELAIRTPQSPELSIWSLQTQSWPVLTYTISNMSFNLSKSRFISPKLRASQGSLEIPSFLFSLGSKLKKFNYFVLICHASLCNLHLRNRMGKALWLSRLSHRL